MIKKQFFSLIELLVVIAVIGILASLLLPALKSSRESAQQVTCQSSIRQVNTAMAMFRSDYDNYIAHTFTTNSRTSMTVDWQVGIDSYLGGDHPTTDVNYNGNQFATRGAAKIWWDCPTTHHNNSIDGWGTDYGLAMSSTKSYIGFKIGLIQQPSTDVVLGDVFHQNGDYTSGYQTFRTNTRYSNQTLSDSGKTYKHARTSSNYAFFDGHVESIKWLPKEGFQSAYLESLLALPNYSGEDNTTHDNH